MWDEWEFVLGNKMEKGVGAKGKLSMIGPCVHIAGLRSAGDGERAGREGTV